MNKLLVQDSDKNLLTPQGEFELERCPRNDQLQAWDAADELLLSYLDELQALTRDSRILILNDAFGALGVALSGYPVYTWNDSCLAQTALRDNLQRNGIYPDRVETNPGINFPSSAMNFILIKIPRVSALLEHQLYAIRDLLQHGSHVIAAGMARHIHSSTLELFESILGPTTTTRARKKARLILVERDHSLNEGQSRYPDSYELELDRVYRIINHANLFSRDRLDQGTRNLIEYMPADPEYHRIVDLACGNGVVGIVAAALNPEARLLFSDESHMAITSARTNFEAAFPLRSDAEFRVADGLQGIDDDSCDLVLLNPPFHLQHSIGDTIAWRLFKDARRVLRSGGELRIVGNRHLGYHAKMKKLFGNCETLSADKKFVVLKVIK